MQAHPQAPALDVDIVGAHLDGRADAREGVDHQADDSPVAQADHGARVDRVQQRSGSLGCQHWRLAPLDRVLRSSDRAGRVGGHDLADDEPVEERSQRGQALLHGRGGQLPRLDVGGDVHRAHLADIGDAVGLAPVGELADRVRVGAPGVRVADGDGEELQTPGGGGFGRRKEHRDALGREDQAGYGRRGLQRAGVHASVK